MKSIGLCMIVRNEAAVIRRCLESMLPLIDYVLIVGELAQRFNVIFVEQAWFALRVRVGMLRSFTVMRALKSLCHRDVTMMPFD